MEPDDIPASDDQPELGVLDPDTPNEPITLEQLHAMCGASYLKDKLLALVEEARTAHPRDVPALKLRADIYRTLLGKVEGDRRAVEHTGELRHSVTVQRIELVDLEPRAPRNDAK